VHAVQPVTAIQSEYSLMERGPEQNGALNLRWGHIAHEEVSEALVNRIQQRVLKGMGLIVLHSGHHCRLQLNRRPRGIERGPLTSRIVLLAKITFKLIWSGGYKTCIYWM
jgi:hypothetical protein